MGLPMTISPTPPTSSVRLWATDCRGETAFDLREVSAGFPDSHRLVLAGISLVIRRGEFVSFVGPSGCGKSTLLRLLAGLLRPSTGMLTRPGDGSGTGTTRVGFVFQHPTLLPWRTAVQNIRLPLELGRVKLARQLPDDQIRRLLEQGGLSCTDADKRPSQLSGGMQMRLSLARALATDPGVLLLDEPLAAVDDLLRLRLQEDIRQLHADRGLTSVLVTHNLLEAVFLSDRVFVLTGTPASVVAEVAVDWAGDRNAEFRNSSVFAECSRDLSTALFP